MEITLISCYGSLAAFVRRLLRYLAETARETVRGFTYDSTLVPLAYLSFGIYALVQVSYVVFLRFHSVYVRLFRSYNMCEE